MDFDTTEFGAWSVDELLELLWFEHMHVEHMSCDQQISLKSALSFLQNFL